MYTDVKSLRVYAFSYLFGCCLDFVFIYLPVCRTCLLHLGHLNCPPSPYVSFVAIGLVFLFPFQPFFSSTTAQGWEKQSFKFTLNAPVAGAGSSSFRPLERGKNVSTTRPEVQRKKRAPNPALSPSFLPSWCRFAAAVDLIKGRGEEQRRMKEREGENGKRNGAVPCACA